MILYKMTEYKPVSYDENTYPEVRRTYIGTWNKCMMKMYEIAEEKNYEVLGKFGGPCVNLRSYRLIGFGNKILIEIEHFDAMIL